MQQSSDAFDICAFDICAFDICAFNICAFNICALDDIYALDGADNMPFSTGLSYSTLV